jgi:8-oxo-dGTP pyrophosphatase MutT (NUDIX family)
MSELLSTCDKFLKAIEPVERDIVHKEGIWHKTAHVWMYDNEGYIYFQVRADADKLYTTASGHVDGNEEPEDTAVRETNEEVGVSIQKDELELIEVDAWQFDNEVKHDHAFAYIYLYKVHTGFKEFNVNLTEVKDIIKVKARDLLSYLLGLPFECEQFDINGNKLKHNKDLLLMDGEVSILKYGRILQAVTKRTYHEKENI